MLQAGDVLVGVPTLNPEFNWYRGWGVPASEEYQFFERLMELPVGYQEFLENSNYGQIKLHGDLLDLCLSKTCLLVEYTTVYVEKKPYTLFEVLCNTMLTETEFTWRKVWVKKSVLEYVLDNYSDYLKKL